MQDTKGLPLGTLFPLSRLPLRVLSNTFQLPPLRPCSTESRGRSQHHQCRRTAPAAAPRPWPRQRVRTAPRAARCWQHQPGAARAAPAPRGSRLLRTARGAALGALHMFPSQSTPAGRAAGGGHRWSPGEEAERCGSAWTLPSQQHQVLCSAERCPRDWAAAREDTLLQGGCPANGGPSQATSDPLWRADPVWMQGATKTTLSLPSALGQGRENKRKGPGTEIRTRRDCSPNTVAGKTESPRGKDLNLLPTKTEQDNEKEKKT